MTAAELKAARAQLGLTQAELAKAVGLSCNSVARYEMTSGQFPVPRWLSLVVRMWLAQKEESSNGTVSPR